MANLSEQDFRKELSSGNFNTLYLIYGDEKYLVKKYTESLVKKAVGKDPSEFDYFHLNSDTPLEEIFDAAEQIPMFSERKCVCVNDYDINALNESDYKQLEKFCSDISPSTVLIFSMPTLNTEVKKKSGDNKKSSKFKKFCSFAEKHGSVLELKKLGEIALERQLVSWAEKNGSKLTQINASKIISMVGTDMTALKNEIDKLSAYAYNEEITYEVIKKLCIKNNEAKIYAISDLISKNDFNGTYRQLHMLFEQNERPEMILSVLSSAFIDMYRVKAATESGKTIADVSSDFKYGRRDFVLKNARNSASKYSGETLKNILDIILQADIKLKSTRTDPQIILETLVAKLLLAVREGNKL